MRYKFAKFEKYLNSIWHRGVEAAAG